MSAAEIDDTNVQDVSLNVIRALGTLDVKSQSYVQLRRLSAALIQVGDQVATETSQRADSDNSGDTISVSSPQFELPR